MTTAAVLERPETKRLRDWARRCRELAELTVVPDVTRALATLAEEMEDAADTADGR